MYRLAAGLLLLRGEANAATAAAAALKALKETDETLRAARQGAARAGAAGARAAVNGGRGCEVPLPNVPYGPRQTAGRNAPSQTLPLGGQ